MRSVLPAPRAFRVPGQIVPVLAALLTTVSAGPLIVAHRGASADAPENTLPAFELAWKQGADAIEGDFHLTRDGRVVCIHDPDTGKVAKRKLVVAKSSLEELRALDVGDWKDPKWAGTRIPTLPEVLATIPAGKAIYIEIKSGPGIIDPLLADLRRAALRDRQIVFISFHQEVIRGLKAKVPQLTANWLVSFKNRTGKGPVENWDRILATLEASGADGLGTNNHKDLQPAHFARLREAGFDHHVWTVDDAATARRFLAFGSKSVTTNVPAVLRKDLAEGP